MRLHRCALLIASGSVLVGCTLLKEPVPEEVAPPPAPPPEVSLVVAEEFGPLEYRLDPALRSRWDQVLELHERLFFKQGKPVEEDDLHRLYNEADADDDDVLSADEVEEAFRRMKREYERYLTRQG